MEEDLVKGLAAGDAAAYQQAYDRYGAALFRTAARMLGSQCDAEDAVQEVFAALVRSRSRLAQIANLKAYVFVSLRHVAAQIRNRRERRAMAGLDETQCLAQCAPEASDESERLWAFVACLPIEQQEVLTMKIQGELTFKDIGAICGISTNTAASRYRYALEKLKQMMEKQE